MLIKRPYTDINTRVNNTPTVTPRYKEFLPPYWIMGLLGLSAIAWFFIQIKEILVLLVLGYSIAFVIEPAISRLEQIQFRGKAIGRVSAFFLLLVIVASVLLLLVMTAMPTVTRQYEGLVNQLPAYIEQAQQKITPLYEQLNAKIPAKFRPEVLQQSPGNLLQFINFESVKKVFAAFVATVVSGYSITLTILNLLLLPFIVFYISADFQVMHRQILLLIPRDIRLNTLKIGREIKENISAFLSAQFIVCIVMFVLYFTGFWIVGLELSLLLAIIAGFGNLIPYFGTFCGIILSSLMALVTFGDWSHLIQVWLVFGVVQFLEGTFITPKIMGKNVGLSPLIVLLALVIAGQLMGLLGLLLAIPVTAALKILLRELHQWLVQQEQIQPE